MGPGGCRNSPPPDTLVPEVRPLLLLPLPSLPLPQDPRSWRGLRGQRIRPGISAASWGPKRVGEPWPGPHLILCTPHGSPISPIGSGISSPPPAAPQGRQSHPTSTSPPLSLPPPYPVAGGSSHPLRCPWSPTSAWALGALVVRRSEFCVLLVHHLDSVLTFSFFKR